MYDEGTIKRFVVLLPNSTGQEEHLLENLQAGMSIVAKLITTLEIHTHWGLLGPKLRTRGAKGEVKSGGVGGLPCYETLG
jgi:hypothetical protein